MKKVFVTFAIMGFMVSAMAQTAATKKEGKAEVKECKKGEKACCKKGSKACEKKTEEKENKSSSKN